MTLLLTKSWYGQEDLTLEGGAVYPATDVQAYMGHEKIETTMRYVHHVPKVNAAGKGSAFIAAQLETVPPLCPEPVRSGHTEHNSAQLSAP